MKQHPFWGALLHKVTWQSSDRIPTAGINGDNNIMINPEFYNSLTEPQQIGLACHEINHGVFFHYDRMMAYPMEEDRMIANIAADYLNNSILTDAGQQLPPDALLDPKYNPDVYTVETLVEELKKSGKVKKVKCGGFNGSDILPDKIGKGRTDSQRRQDELDMKMAVASAAMIAKKRGNLPGMLDRFVNELLKPTQDWKEETRAWLDRKVKEATSWSRPNRRFIVQGKYFPSKYSLGCGHIGIAVDVSGSIGQSELDIWGSELNHAFEACNPSKVTVLYFDHIVQKVEEHTELPIKLHTVGGGGTNFGCAFDYFNNKVDDLVGLIFMTDMFGDWPKEPQYPVLVLSTTPKMVAPFGRTLYTDIK